MKTVFAYLTAGFVGAGLLLSQCALRSRPLAGGGGISAYADTCVVHLSRSYWPTYVAATFYRNGKPLQPAGPFATRPTDTLEWFRKYKYLADPREGTEEEYLNTQKKEGDFRFGQVHMTFKSYSGFSPIRLRDVYVECVSGRDTMHVVLVADMLYNTFYDSIPFKPGYYKVYDKFLAYRLGYIPEPDALNSLELRNSGRVFAPYFAKHQHQLAKHNPFAGCVFQPQLKDANELLRAPRSPADIIEFMLTKTDFYRDPIGKIVPTAKWVRQKKIILREK